MPDKGIIMYEINLTFKTVNSIDFSGLGFYVAEGDLFDADDYAEAYRINRDDISDRDIHAVQDATGHLNLGEWLQVEHA